MVIQIRSYIESLTVGHAVGSVSVNIVAGGKNIIGTRSMNSSAGITLERTPRECMENGRKRLLHV
jgi:hypothetical protein